MLLLIKAYQCYDNEPSHYLPGYIELSLPDEKPLQTLLSYHEAARTLRGIYPEFQRLEFSFSPMEFWWDILIPLDAHEKDLLQGIGWVLMHQAGEEPEKRRGLRASSVLVQPDAFVFTGVGVRYAFQSIPLPLAEAQRLEEQR